MGTAIGSLIPRSSTFWALFAHPFPFTMRRALFLAPFAHLFIFASVLASSIRDARAGGLRAEPRHLSAFDELLGSPPWVPRLQERERDCINLRGNIGPRFRGAFYFDDSGKKANPTKDTVIKRDAVVTQITEVEVVSKGASGFTCDHILELNILKTVINLSGGLCERAEKLTDPVDAKRRLEKIREVVNRPDNLVSFKSPGAPSRPSRRETRRCLTRRKLSFPGRR